MQIINFGHWGCTQRPPLEMEIVCFEPFLTSIMDPHPAIQKSAVKSAISLRPIQNATKALSMSTSSAKAAFERKKVAD